MIKSYKFHVYPTDKQEIKLNKTLDLCRNLYNKSLEERMKAYELKQMTVHEIIKKYGKDARKMLKIRRTDNYSSQQNNLPVFKLNHLEYNDVYSQVLQDVLKRLDKAYQNFYRRVKNGENPGFPRFKSKNRYDSFIYSQSGFKLLKTKNKDDSYFVELSKIGKIRMFKHRLMEGKIKMCTVKRDIDRWYVVFTNEIEKQTPEISIINKVGIDVGLKTFLTLSNGEQINSPKFLLESEKRLSKEQRRLSRKKFKQIEINDRKTNKLIKIKIPTENRKKQRIKVAKVHRTIRNQRMDFNHKTSRMIVDNYDMIVFEDLNIQNMMMNSHNIRNRNISDVAWYQLQTFTSYKAEWAGKKVIFVDAKNTSQECSNCGIIVKKDLSVRSHNCICGLSIDRDLNAAINILNRGMKYVPTDCGELKPMESMQKQLNETGSSVLKYGKDVTNTSLE